MTARLMEAFQKRKEKGDRPLFIPFLMAGDPSEKETLIYMKELAQEGADVIELGIPYSDPLADGPVIQMAAAKALAAGMKMEKVFDLIRTAREESVALPIVLLTYINPVLQYGVERFFTHLASAGGDGVILPDLPYEESEQVLNVSRNLGIPLIPLVAPTSKERLAKILSKREGFIYAVSSLGVTGARDHFSENLLPFLQEIRSHSNLPVCVGFGLSKREQVEELSPYCDGVIVGSALIRHLHEGKGIKEFCEAFLPSGRVSSR
ncbi:Tryptophan synthase alpha chain [[Clostridium] ultunense Esp]|nr:Tryptophan synthase alpha chain [[Clostridium] ultunense Esp]